MRLICKSLRKSLGKSLAFAPSKDRRAEALDEPINIGDQRSDRGEQDQPLPTNRLAIQDVKHRQRQKRRNRSNGRAKRGKRQNQALSETGAV